MRKSTARASPDYAAWPSAGRRQLGCRGPSTRRRPAAETLLEAERGGLAVCSCCWTASAIARIVGTVWISIEPLLGRGRGVVVGAADPRAWASTVSAPVPEADGPGRRRECSRRSIAVGAECHRASARRVEPVVPGRCRRMIPRPARYLLRVRATSDLRRAAVWSAFGPTDQPRRCVHSARAVGARHVLATGCP